MIKIKKPSDAPTAKPGGFLWKILASFFGTGYFPVAPGTFASVIAILILWFIPYSHVLWAILIIGITLLGILVSQKAEFYWGKDPSKIVIDEVIGCIISVIFLPKSILLYAGAFLAFRFFDIFKLEPAKTVEKKFHGGTGVMFDDIVAGIYAAILVNLINIIFPQIQNLI